MRQVLVVTLVVASALLACKKEDAPDPAPAASAPAAPVAAAPAQPSASVAATAPAAPTAVGTTHALPVSSAGKPTSGVFEPSGFGHGTTATAQPTATSTGGSAALVAPTKPTSTAAATAAPKPTATATAAATGSTKPPKTPSPFAPGFNPATGKSTDKGSTGDAVHRNRTTHAPTRPGAQPK